MIARVRPALHALEILSILELASIAVLMLNLVTLHLRPVTAAMGPTHGALFLAVAVTALFARDLLPRTRWMALIPVAGGVLTLVNVRAERRRGAVV
jgi:hypothetical protein